ncbi:hypothetical protein HNP32_001286 [Brevundimonas bullata]|uniref:Uncharacterized protein n=1 Tax=Brevundimonas bullata TaxID=13160 RepID=A0A7W7INW1_9CAUL|nr:hypothetical protein [Brevundimonas bullata]MBB4797562.1 hypothetical protein [Brevundimonas bullata]MBB6382522.1 hypothetical protein [Brevundimonas bullata]
MSWIGYTAAGAVAVLILRMLFDELGRFFLGQLIAVGSGLFCTAVVAAQVAERDVLAVAILGFLATLWLDIQVIALLAPEPAGAPYTITQWVLTPATALREWGGW